MTLRQQEIDRAFNDKGGVKQGIISRIRENLVKPLDGGVPTLLDKRFADEAKYTMAVDLLNRFENSDLSINDLLAETTLDRNNNEKLETIKFLSGALLEPYFQQENSKEWSDRSATEKGVIRLGEVLGLEVDRRLVERRLNKDEPFNDKTVAEYSKLFNSYAENKDIPSWFVGRLHKTATRLVEKYPTPAQPEAKKVATPEKQTKDETLPQHISEALASASPDKDYSWVTPEFFSDVEKERAAMKRERMTTENISVNLNSQSAEVLQKFYDKRLSQTKVLYKDLAEKIAAGKVDSTVMRDGTLEALKAMVGKKMPEEYVEAIKINIDNFASQGGYKNLLGADNAHAHNFIDSLKQQFAYENKGRLGKFFNRAKVFGFWNTINPWGRTKEKLQGVRHVTANILRSAALDQKRDPGAIRRIVFIEIAETLDQLNHHEVKTWQGIK